MNNLKKNICVITGSRAEYGLLYLILKLIKKSKKLNLKLFVTGSHLSSEYGNTYKQIESDGFIISKKIRILKSKNSKKDVAISLSRGIELFAGAFVSTKPDIILILGDRYEIFAAASAAMIMNIPIAHIHGGELTIGAIDDAIRHSITKMAHIHFATTSAYKKRIIQLGENPRNVFNVGAPGVENITKLKLLNKIELQKKLKIKMNKKNLLITFHPITLSNELTKKYFLNLLSCLSSLKETNLFFTKANADANGKIINSYIDKYINRSTNSFSFTSLGQIKYLSLLNQVDGVIGNSSSGIIEAPSLRKGTINIGDRQLGREKAQSVIDCGYEVGDISKAIKLLYSKNFNKVVKKSKNPYFKSNTSKNIVNKIESLSLDGILFKYFFDQ